MNYVKREYRNFVKIYRKKSENVFKIGLKYTVDINVNIKMYIFDHLRMYIFAILPLDRYIFLSDKIFP